MPTSFNVIHVVSDQHLATCAGYEAHPQAVTPHMDQLAAKGTRFRYAYAQNPICTPSRVSMLSGQYCHNHGYYGLSGPAPHALPSFLSHFHQHGYRTAGIGKLHTPNEPCDWLEDHCDLYAECYDYQHRGPDMPQRSAYYEFLADQNLSYQDDDSIALQEFEGKQQHEARPSKLALEHSVEGWCVERARQFIDESHAMDKPFCMQVSLPRPHQCYTPNQQFWDLYPDDIDLPPTFENDSAHRAPHFQHMVNHYRENYKGLIEPRDWVSVSKRVWRGYLACLTQVDWALGQIMQHLANMGLSDRTIVIYHSDHGAYSGTFGVPEKAPGICSEAVCRVPFIWYVPGVSKAGHVSTQLVESLDLAATLCALCGLPEMASSDGCNLTSLLQGQDQPLRQVAVTEHPWSKSIRWDQWRLVHYQSDMFPGQDIGELYDIHVDPDETTNYYHDPVYREIVEHGRRLLLEWLIGTSRLVTCWPPPHGSSFDSAYPMAGDGKLTRKAGPQRLVEQSKDSDTHWLNYL